MAGAGVGAGGGAGGGGVALTSASICGIWICCCCCCCCWVRLLTNSSCWVFRVWICCWKASCTGWTTEEYSVMRVAWEEHGSQRSACATPGPRPSGAAQRQTPGEHPEGCGGAVGSKVQGPKACVGSSCKITNSGLTPTEHLNLARRGNGQCCSSSESPHKGDTQGRPCPRLTHRH